MRRVRPRAGVRTNVDRMNRMDCMDAPAHSKIYFDAAASLPATDACRRAWAEFDAQPWAGANPHALHSYGRAAFTALEDARHTLARCLGARRPNELVFTSGGTESNNLAVLGIAQAIFAKTGGARRCVLVSAIEHDSVLTLGPLLARRGIELVTIPVSPQGVLDLDAFDALLCAGEKTARSGGNVSLVSVMAVNNELGTIQPLQEICRRAHAAGALMHTDAVQAFGKINLPLASWGIDAASVSAHKLGGPVGIGALYLKARTPLEPLFAGGGQETGLRSGTANVRSACAFAAVARDACDRRAAHQEQITACARIIIDGLCTGPGAVARLSRGAGLDDQATPGTLNFIVPGVPTQSLILALDERGYEVSGGSSCSARSTGPSHVLAALGIPRDDALCALRVSFDARISRDQAQGLVDAIYACVAGIKGRAV